jgi:hypothetical protein
MKTAQTIEVATGPEEFFGQPISRYSRAQAIADGLLVDVSAIRQPNPFTYPVAMTRAAWAATIEAGGNWLTDNAGTRLALPPGQDIQGRLHDVFCVLLMAIQSHDGPSDQIEFPVLVDMCGDGQHTRVDLYSVCGPGDTNAPVITILLQGED